MSKTGLKFSYRTSADIKLRRILETIKKPNQDRYADRGIEFLSLEKPVVQIMEELIETTAPTENGFSMSVLKRRYEESGISSFTLDELFKEGWLVQCGSEWMHNCRPDKYAVISFCESDREKDIIRFLDSLSDIRYTDQYALWVNTDQESYLKILDRYDISTECLIDYGIISKEEDEKDYFIDSSEKIWQSIGNRVLSNYGNRILKADYTDRNQLYERWIDIYRRIPYVYDVLYMIEDKEALFQQCLRIIKPLNSTRENERKKILCGLRLATDSMNPLYDADIPDNCRLRNEYFERNIDLIHEISYLTVFSRTLCGKALQICYELFTEMSQKLREEFLEIISDPYFEIHRHFQGYSSGSVWDVEAIHFDGLRYEALVGIYGIFQRTVSDRMMPIYDVNQFATSLWDVIYNILPQDNESNAVYDVIEFLIYLGRSCQFGVDNDIKGKNQIVGINQTARKFFDFLIMKFHEEFAEYSGINDRVRNYLSDRINHEPNDIEVKMYLQMLFAFTRMVKGKGGECRKWQDLSRAKLLQVLQRSINERFGLSTIPFGAVTDVLSEDLFEHMQTGRDILHIVQGGKEPSNHYDWFTTEGWGTVLALYYMSSDSRHWNTEDTWKEYIDVLIRFQSVVNIFGTEKIELYGSRFILQKCMEVLSDLPDDGKELFLSHIIIESQKSNGNFGISTLLTWARFITHSRIKRRLIEIAANLGQHEIGRIANSVDGLTTLFNKTVNVAIWYRETIGNDEKVITGLVSIAKKLQSDYEFRACRVAGNGSLRARADRWLEDSKSQLLYLSGKTDELASKGGNFYRGIVMLESDNRQDIIEAAKVFENLFDGGSIAAGINAMAAWVELTRIGIENEEDITELRTKFESVRRRLESVFQESGIVPESGYYYSILLFYGLVSESEIFKEEYKKIPESIRYEPNITEIAVDDFLYGGDYAQAEKIFEICKSIYGENQITDRIDKALQDKSNKKKHCFQNVSVGVVTNEDNMLVPDSHAIMRVLEHLRNMHGDEIYQFYYYSGTVDEKLLRKLGISVMNGKDERLMVLDMLLSAATELRDYSYNLARNIFREENGNRKKVGKAYPKENTYNRTLASFIERRENRIFDYHVECERRAGMTEADSDRIATEDADTIEVKDINDKGDFIINDGEESKEIESGSIDVLIRRKEQDVCIIEGIRIIDKINSSERERIIKHIRKTIGYDTRNVRVAAMVVYYIGNDRPGTWNEYLEILKDLKKDNDDQNKKNVSMEDYVDTLNPKNIGVESNYPFLFASIHRVKDLNETLLMFHIMVPVGRTDT